MDAHLTEWLNLGIRWIHMIVGIAWIGASFYFVWLENNLNRSNPREGLSGDLWAIHGGGIYHLEKYKLAPPQMPENLHWFKWEAYTTWLSGVALLLVVYYLNPSLYLIAPGSDLAPATAVAIGFGSLIVGWFVYDLLCDSPLGKTPALLGLALFVLVIAACWGYSQIFSGRAAYIHTGALMGTIMVGNVFRIIMPAQRALVAAIEQNRTPDPVLPAKGLLRSRHNNYFTLPVLFIMISNHFPSTYGSQYNWLILAGLAALSVLVRHFFNTRLGAARRRGRDDLPGLRHLAEPPEQRAEPGRHLAGTGQRHGRGPGPGAELRRGQQGHRRALRRLPLGQAEQPDVRQRTGRGDVRHARADPPAGREDPRPERRQPDHAAGQHHPDDPGRA